MTRPRMSYVHDSSPGARHRRPGSPRAVGGRRGCWRQQQQRVVVAVGVVILVVVLSDRALGEIAGRTQPGGLLLFLLLLLPLGRADEGIGGG